MSSPDMSVGLLDGAHTLTLFCSSAPLALLDHFRVPYEVDSTLATDGIEQLRGPKGGPVLYWSRLGDAKPQAAHVLGADGETEIPLFAKMLPDPLAETMLTRHGGSWKRARKLAGAGDTICGSIWRCEDDSVFLPFDPDEVLLNYWSERYLRVARGSKLRPLRRQMMLAYYRLRPFLPRLAQIWMRRRFARLQARSGFPRWPVETCLHDFFDLMLGILGDIAGGSVPYIAPWPKGYDWALVVTHDVEQAEGLAVIDRVLELERRYRVRSAWNFVPRRYEVDPDLVSDLIAAGLEVGVHGLHHDGRDLESLATWRDRLPGIREAAERWGAAGFRSPALHRRWDWMQMLEFEYDSSFPDTDPFEPQDGGCCTWLPFFNGQLIELPLTIPQDHTVFVILQELDETLWVEKAEFLRARGGLALLNTHPDYLVEPRVHNAYAGFLDHFADDETVWRALPKEVSSWWRRRAASCIERDGDAWRIVGPAAGEARVELHGGAW